MKIPIGAPSTDISYTCVILVVGRKVDITNGLGQ